jgi:hypothetical protein
VSDDQPDGVEDAVAALHAFWVAMFEYETRWFREWKRSYLARRNGTGEDDSSIDARAGQERAEILARHCTPKKRVYSSGGSFGEDPLYDPDRETVDNAVRESAGRVVVYTTKTSFGSRTPLRRRYVVIRRAGTWLVDNIQQPHLFTDAWTRAPL